METPCWQQDLFNTNAKTLLLNKQFVGGKPVFWQNKLPFCNEKINYISTLAHKRTLRNATETSSFFVAIFDVACKTVVIVAHFVYNIQ